MDKYNYSLNKERLKRYIVNDIDNKGDIIDLYLWNIILSKELYPLIALLEVALRNHINNAISQNIRNKWLLDQNLIKNILKDKELRIYSET
ncbi:MAG: hypothetical protein WCG23_07970 [bacterium]